MENTQTTADVVVVGGGAAGLAAAVALARSRRSVVVADAGEPRNAPAAGMHNYLGREEIAPHELTAAGRAELASYDGRVVAGRVIRAVADDDGFLLTLEDESTLRARRVILATGVLDRLPEITGLAQRWGREVVHCPYCHGWELRDTRVGVLSSGPMSLHQLGLFRQLTDQVHYFTQGHELGHDDRFTLHARGVVVVERPVVEVVVDDDALTGARLADGTVVALDALAVASYAVAPAELAAQLGVQTREVQMGGQAVATILDADPMGATAVPGVYVAGNAADFAATVMAAAASGTKVGALVNAHLVEEDTAAAVARARVAMREPAAWDERYADTAKVWSGKVNPTLARHAGQLAPGSAVDVGCGEGGDVLWLAQHGWRATGVDFSTAGLARARSEVEAAGAETEWLAADARTWSPDRQWDLVSAHYLHLPIEAMRDVVRRLAAAVAPGGTLLVVGHHPDDMPAGHPAAGDAFRAEDLAPVLDPAQWTVRVEEAERTGTGHGHDVPVRDTILVARQR